MLQTGTQKEISMALAPIEARTNIHYFKNNESLTREEVRTVITPEIDELLGSRLSEGESAIISGSTAGHFLRHTGPIDWKNISAQDRSDIDIMLMGPKSVGRSNRIGTYLLEKSKTSTGVRYELVDGMQIVRDIHQAACDVQKQAILAYYAPDQSPKMKLYAQDLTERAEEIALVAENDPMYAVMLNNTLRESALGIKATKVNGEMQYSVFDPFEQLDDFLGVNDQVQNWDMIGSVAGLTSVGLPVDSIHRLLMHTEIAFGHINTKVPLALNLPGRIFRLAYEDAVGELVLSSDGIGLRSNQSKPNGFFTLGGNDILAIDSVEQMKIYLRMIMRAPAYSDLTDTEVKATKGQANHEQHLRNAAQQEFARCAFYGTRQAIYYAFSYFNFGTLIAPGVDRTLQSYHKVFDDIHQVTLDRYISRHILSRLLPKESRDAAAGLNFFENVSAACSQLYKEVHVYGYPGTSIPDGKNIPVYRQSSSPRNMSEVFALLYLCSGNANPSEQELQELCDRWLPNGELEPSYINIPTNFRTGISVTEIQSSLDDLSRRLKLPHANTSARSFEQDSHAFRRFNGIQRIFRRVKKFVANT